MATTATQKTTTGAKPRKPKKRTLAAALAADRRARERGEAASTMTAAERRELLTMQRRHTAQSAPTMEAADSDLLTMLFVVASEFARRYYPDTTHGSLHFSNYNANGDRGWSVHLPFPLPPATPAPLTAEDVKATVRRYADSAHPNWDSANVTIGKGEVSFDERERCECLLIDSPRASAK